MNLEEINARITMAHQRLQEIADRTVSMAWTGKAVPGNPEYDALMDARTAYLRRAEELVAEAEKLLGMKPSN